MSSTRKSGIIISSVYHLPEEIDQADAVISILGGSDKLMFPDVGSRPVLRLKFDDVGSSFGKLVAPSHGQIAELLEFARAWNGVGNVLVHCRAGSSRSPAAAMVAAAARGLPDGADLVLRVQAAKGYFRPTKPC